MLFQIIAILLLIAFYGCYFTKMLRQRRQNIQTDQLGKGKTGFVRLIEVLLKVFSFLIVFAEIACVFDNQSLTPLGLRLLGVALGACGAAVFIVSVLEMKDSWRAGVPEKAETALVTGGIYRYSRNPAFLGFDLIYIGVLLMFFRWALLIVTVITALLFHLQIVNVEEPFLIDAFGQEYLDYRKSVCRYLGRRKGA